MKKVMVQEQHNGEWFDIWETAAECLEEAFEEMDEKPEFGCHIKFDGDDEYLIVNGGF